MWKGKTRHWKVPVVFLLLFFVVETIPAEAQRETGLVISGGIHGLTFPWHLDPMTTRLNPTFMVGADRGWKSGESWRLFYAVNLGFYRDHWWMTGISIEPEVGIERSIPGGFHADVRVGLGYMHYFWRRETLELEDGRYVEATDWGRPSLIVPLSATLGYRGSSDRPLGVAPFVSARWGAQGLFMEEVPVMTHLQLLGGVRIERGREPESGGR